MAVNPYILDGIKSNLLYAAGDGDTRTSGFTASEMPLVPDNMNRHLANFTKLLGGFTAYTSSMNLYYSSEANRSAGSWWTPNSNGCNWAARANGGYFTRLVNFSDELSYYGQVASTMGFYGFSAEPTIFDRVGDGTVNYEPPYGHGVATWPVANTQAQQFRDATSLPSDGSSRINLTGSAWTRSPYLPPVYYVAHIVQGGTLASGNVKFIVEQRPSYWMTHAGGSRHPHLLGDSDVTTMHPAISRVAYQCILGKIHGRPDKMFTVDDAGTIRTGDDPAIQSRFSDIVGTDPRIREHAVFPVNPDYYGMVQGSYLLVFSSKTSLVPVLAKNLVATWPDAADKRIAGVVVDPSMNIWVLSGSGELRLLDMSVEGGQWVTKASAPAPASKEKYGALVLQGTKLWALAGTYAKSPLTGSTTSSTVGVIPFDTVAGTWGTRSNSPLPARHNSRSLQEMVPMSDGRVAAVVESVADSNVAPSVLSSYALPDTMVIGVAGGRTLVSKLDARAWSTPLLPRFRILLGWSYGVTSASAVIKRVPAGSPAGTLFTDSAVVTVGGSAQWGTPASGTQTDWVGMPLDPDYDYYFFYKIEGASAQVSRSVTPTGPYQQATYLDGDHLGDVTVPATNSPLACNWIISGINNGVDTYAGVTNTKSGTVTSPTFQLLVYNPSDDSWNTTALNAGSAMTYDWSLNDGPYWAPQMNLIEGSAGRLVVKSGWGTNRLNTFDATGTLDNTKFTDVSYGSAKSLFGTNVAFASVTQMQKNTTDGSVLFVPTNQTATSGDADGYTLGWAPPGFAWDGTEQIQVVLPNASGGGNVPGIAKDKLFPVDLGQGYNYLRFWRVCPLFADTSATIINLGCALPENSATAAYMPYAIGGVYHLPRYFKYSGGAWKIAKNWADAVANPYTAPTVPDTAIQAPEGLTFLFGPSAGTTYITGEYHTINCAYGQVKFARRGRYAFTMFAGRTFQNAETKTLAALRGIKPRIYNHPSYQLPPTATGPSGITGSGGYFSWPVQVGGVLNDVPVTVTYDFSLSRPDADSIIPIMVSGNVAADGSDAKCSASSQNDTTTWGVWKAFSRRAVVADGAEGWKGTGDNTTNAAIAADLGVGKAATALSFSLRMRWTNNFAMATAWKIQGATEAAPASWVDLGSYTLPAGQTWAPVGATEPFLGTITSPGAYRHYRLLLPTTGAYPSVASLELYDQPLKTTGINFSDIFTSIGGGVQAGLKVEVDTGSGFAEITPKWRSHHGEILVFDRQTNVTGVRVTSKTGRYSGNDTSRSLSPMVFWDYGTQAKIDAARLGSAAAADNTRERGSFDTQCMGVNTDAIGVSVDGVSPALYTALWSSEYDHAVRGWYTRGPWHTASTPRSYVVHPYFGFVFLNPNVTGTNVTLSYAWGRRV